MTTGNNSPTRLQKFSMSILFRLLQRMKYGRLTLILPDHCEKHFGDPVSPDSTRIEIHDYRFFTDFVLGGTVGLGESFMEGIWDTKDIPALFRVLIRNRSMLTDGSPVTSWLSRQKNRLFQFVRENTLTGSRKNIRDHYDLSNEFFQLFLDPTMLYSCGIYSSENDTCQDAQANKIKRIIDKAHITSTDHVLEIGCGWCGFAMEAVKQTGCSVTGITISKEQYQLAVDRVKQEKLQEKIKILFQDYREVKGLYDKIISIEMLEAVGHRYLGPFFQCCDRLLKPGGLLVIQVITIPDQRYDLYCRETDWIQKHIFPGGHLPSVTVLSEAATKYSNFIMEKLENIGTHYATTLRDWREKYLLNIESISALGFDRVFQRKWEYYLATCEAGFAERILGDIQVVFRKPQ
ncbi:MAG: SAM-dependent methyltransferase [Deltaproteobacteria bacterium HGW-Deltaproteobacteria-13]|nr:MAG: SAM-dependent methyltransferase [Deltaproteobacteria bacterium HGW-Deltaproteobacteria-13]